MSISNTDRDTRLYTVEKSVLGGIRVEVLDAMIPLCELWFIVS
jgi:hypothetical protein